MSIDPPAGYLTRPEASRLYNRSQRALERDLNTALGVGDSEVLSRFMLLTKDGEIRGAEAVTIEQVKGLVSEGMSPVWCVEEAWLETEFGRKGEPRPAKPTASPSDNRGTPAEDENEVQDETDPDLDVIEQPDPHTLRHYRAQLKKQEQEIRNLWKELAIKNEQIKEANLRTRESNLLMQELQKMLGSWQSRAFESLPTKPNPGAMGLRPTETETAPQVHIESTEPKPKKSASKAGGAKAGNKTPRNPRSSRKKQTGRKKSTRRAKAAKNTKAGWNEFPTVKRWLSRNK